MKKTGVTLINTVKIVLIILTVSCLGYFFGFSTLFAHSVFEIFYYAILFSSVIVLSNTIEYLVSKLSTNIEVKP